MWQSYPAVYKTAPFVYIMDEVMKMAEISPAVREKFDTLSADLRSVILERGEDLHTIHDLIRVLGDIVKEEGQ